MNTPDPREQEIARLKRIVTALMDRAERGSLARSSDFSLFQAAVVLEGQVRARTRELEAALEGNRAIARALRESQALFEALVDQSLVGIAVVEEGRLTYCNPRLAAIFATEPSQLLGSDPCRLVAPAESARLKGQLQGAQAAHPVRYRTRALRRDGREIDIEVHCGIAALPDRRVQFCLVMDISERAEAERAVLRLQEQLREQSLHDPLTGLCNRRHFAGFLPRLLQRASRQRRPVALVMADLDRFKDLNDRHGHAAGDRALQAVAEVLEAGSRPLDRCYRHGGEEFVLVMPATTALEGALLAERLRAQVAALWLEGADGRMALSASFGVAAFPLHGHTAAQLLASADRALYQAKRSGRNCVVVADAEAGAGMAGARAVNL